MTSSVPGATAGVGALAGCSGSSETPAFEESFEDGLGDWESGAAIGPQFDLLVAVTPEGHLEVEREECIE